MGDLKEIKQWRKKASPHIFALEPRMLFDGVSVAENQTNDTKNLDSTIQDILHIDSSSLDVAPSATKVTQLNVIGDVGLSIPALIDWQNALTISQKSFIDFLNSDRYLSTLSEIFQSQNLDLNVFNDKAENLKQLILSLGLNAQIELRSSNELQGYLAAYHFDEEVGKDHIYVNRDWIEFGVGQEMINRAILEEIGHALDRHLNGASDSLGDEGEYFSRKISNDLLSIDEINRIKSDNDSIVLKIDNQFIQAEHANVTFLKAYLGNGSTYGTNTNSIAITTPIAASGFVFTSADPTQVSFSGNNIAGQLTYTANGQELFVNGIISRRDTGAGGIINSFYFLETTTLGGTTPTGKAYLLIVPGRESSTSDNSSVGTNSAGVDEDLNALKTTEINNLAPVITSNGGGASSNINVYEGTTAVTTVQATDTDTKTYLISGGSDTSKFSINSSTGVLTFKAAPDYENPGDTDLNNIYNVEVKVVDTYGAYDIQDIIVNVLDVNDSPPTITSNGGGSAATINITQGLTSVTTVQATDPDTNSSLTYYLDSVNDYSLFSINSSTGELRFLNAAIVGTYSITVGVYDNAGKISGHLDTQVLSVVVDSSDRTPPTAIINSITSPRNTNAGIVSIVFSESVTGVDITDFTLTKDGVSVSLSGLTVSGSGTSYSINLSTVTTTGGTYVLTLKSSLTSIKDSANNELTSGSSISWIMDITSPTVAITSVNPDIAFGETELFTFTFSEVPYNFSITDIILTNGSISGDLVWTSDKVFTVYIKSTSATSSLTVAINSGSYTDQSGNLGGSATKTLTITPPAIDLENTSTSDTGYSSIDNYTNNTQPKIVGSVSSGTSSIWIQLVNTTSGVTTTYTYSLSASGGLFSLDMSTTNTTSGSKATLTNGIWTSKLFTSNPSVPNVLPDASSTFTIDTINPVRPTVNSQSTNNPSPTITGTVDLTDLDIFTVTVDAVVYTVNSGLVINYTDKTWSLPLPVSLASGTYSIVATLTDAAGNTLTDSSNNELIIDTLRPTIAITSDKTTLKAGETATITFTLSESSSDFTSSDVTVSGGTLSGFTGSGTSYTATFTPTTNSTTSGEVSVSSTTFSDAAGNTNNDGADANNTVTMTVDTLRPTIAITSDKTTLKAGETATITFTLSESSSDFTSSDVTVSGGTLSGFTGSGTSYTATFTPTTNSTTSGVVSVSSTTFSDAAGNTNNDGADANNTVTMTVDTLRPTIAITSDKTTLKAGETATITFTLSESSSDFTSSDVTVSGGTLSGFTGSGTSYTATFTPTTNSTTSGEVSVSSTTFSDAAGNTNNDGADANNTVTMTVDTLRPTIAITSDKTTLKAGETATITFTLSESSSDFTSSDVTVSGGTLSGFTGSGTSYTATFTPTTNSTTSGEVSVSSTTFSDAAGNTNNDGADANNTVTMTVDTLRPTIAITSDKTTLKAGETATITFTLSESSSDFTSSDVTVSGGTLSGFTGSGTSYTATFTPTTNSTTSGVVSVSSTTFSDAAGNTNNDGADANNTVTMTVDTLRPTIAITSDKTTLKAGETATITFTLSESSSDFTSSDVTVSGGTLSGFTGSGTSYTATFTPTTNSTTSGVVSVSSTTFSDAAGNTNNDGADANNTVTMTVDTVVVSLSNTAPVLDNTKTPVLISEAEDAGLPSGSVGTLISSLVDIGGSLKNVSDLDTSALIGIALTGVDLTNGNWYYTTDAGITWSTVGVITESSALLLKADSNTRLYFNPTANWNGTVSNAITFRAWDQTSGTAGSKVDTTTNGGITAFSTDIDVADIVVTEVNDTPTRTAGSFTSITTAEDAANSSAVTLGLSNVTYGPGGGTDESSQTLTYTVTAIPSFIKLYKADGTTEVTASTTLTATELQGLKYKTIADANGTGSITWTVTDNGTTNGTSDPKTLTESLSVTVTAVNDAPTLASVTPGSVADQANSSDLGSTSNLYGTLAGSDVDTGTTLTYGVSDSSTASYTSDLSGSSITYNKSKVGSYGTLYLNTTTGKYLYVADPALVNALPLGTNPSENFTFSVTDGIATTTTSYTVNITGANDTPIINDATVNLNEKSGNGFEVYDVNTVHGQSKDTDIENQTVTYSIISGNDLGIFTIDPSTGKITIADVTKIDFKTNTTVNLVVRASDGTLTDNATITINVSSMNNNLTFLTRNMPPPGMGPKREVSTAEENETEIETNKLTEDLDEVSIAIKPHFAKPTLVNTQLKNSVKPLKIASPEMPVKDSVKSDNNNTQQQNALNQKNETGLRNTLTPPDAMTDHKGHVTYKLPEGTFSNGHGAISMIAVQKDGSPLPSWVKFDGVTGKISADVPKGVSGPLEIKVQATDSKGDKAETVFKIQPRVDKVSFVGKKSLSDQFKNAFDLVA